MNATQSIPYEHGAARCPIEVANRREEAAPDLEPDDLVPARGVFFAAVLGLALWMVLFGVGWLIFH